MGEGMPPLIRLPAHDADVRGAATGEDAGNGVWKNTRDNRDDLLVPIGKGGICEGQHGSLSLSWQALRVVVHPEEDPDVVYGGVMGKGGYIPVPQLLPRPRRAGEHPVAMPQAGTKRVANATGLRSAEVLGQRVNVASGGIRSHGEESPWRRRSLGDASAGARNDTRQTANQWPRLRGLDTCVAHNETLRTGSVCQRIGLPDFRSYQAVNAGGATAIRCLRRCNHFRILLVIWSELRSLAGDGVQSDARIMPLRR